MSKKQVSKVIPAIAFSPALAAQLDDAAKQSVTEVAEQVLQLTAQTVVAEVGVVETPRQSGSGGPLSKTVLLDFMYRSQSPAFYEVLLPEGDQGRVSWLRKSALVSACVDDGSGTVRVQMPRPLAVRRKLMGHEVTLDAVTLAADLAA
jgi:hypothetical protein